MPSIGEAMSVRSSGVDLATVVRRKRCMGRHGRQKVALGGLVPVSHRYFLSLSLSIYVSHSLELVIMYQKLELEL